MTPFFNTDERRKALWKEMESWLGTPFILQAASKGHGVDCVRLVQEILATVGAIPALELPAYKLDRAKHTTDSQLLRFMLEHPLLSGRLELIPFQEDLKAGDLLGLKCGRADHHLALVSPWNECVHAHDVLGVIRTPLNDRDLRRRVVYVLRILEKVEPEAK